MYYGRFWSDLSNWHRIFSFGSRKEKNKGKRYDLNDWIRHLPGAFILICSHAIRELLKILWTEILQNILFYFFFGLGGYTINGVSSCINKDYYNTTQHAHIHKKNRIEIKKSTKGMLCCLWI